MAPLITYKSRNDWIDIKSVREGLYFVQSLHFKISYHLKLQKAQLL
jgi:hypothetical protein